jgi:hypothetical protein
VVEAIETLECGETADEADDFTPVEIASPPTAPVEEEGPKRDRRHARRPLVRRRKKRPQTSRDWGRWALVTGLSLVSMASLLLLLVLIRHTR